MCPAISITSSFYFFSVYDILIILLMYHVFAASSLLSRSFVSVQHSQPCRRMNHNYVGFHSVGFGANSDISIGEDGLHLGECVFTESYSFLYSCIASGVWNYCEAHVFKGAYLFYSFLFVKNVTYRNDDHALSPLCIQLKSFVFTFDCDCCNVRIFLQFILRISD